MERIRRNFLLGNKKKFGKKMQSTKVIEEWTIPSNVAISCSKRLWFPFKAQYIHMIGQVQNIVSVEILNGNKESVFLDAPLLELCWVKGDHEIALPKGDMNGNFTLRITQKHPIHELKVSFGTDPEPLNRDEIFYTHFMTMCASLQGLLSHPYIHYDTNPILMYTNLIEPDKVKRVTRGFYQLQRQDIESHIKNGETMLYWYAIFAHK
jgi:hypothetical protein